VITRRQALDAGMSTGAITARIQFGKWRRVNTGVYATFTGPMSRGAQLWAAVLSAGPGAQLSHESAAEVIRLTDRRSPLIHVTIPANRRVIPHQGVKVHISSYLRGGWRFVGGIPPHTFAEQTVIDLVHAADNLDDVIACVTMAFARRLTDADRLREEAAARGKLRWRADLDDVIGAAAGGAHSRPRQRRDRHRRIDAPLRLDRRHPQAVRLGRPGACRAHQGRLRRPAQALFANLHRAGPGR
jgi:hypothetical protein